MERIPQGDIITQQFIVKKETDLLEFLIENKIRKSKNAIQSVLRRRFITVNGKFITQHNHLLKKGDKVAVMKVDQAKKIKRLKGMTIVYEDESIIIINKEAGLLSVPTDKEKLKTANTVLTEYVRKTSRNAQIFVLHRLDREASGLMIFGKSLMAQGRFQNSWNIMVPAYDYTVVVEGEMPSKAGEIKSWLTENKNYQVFSSSFDNGGMEAVTGYKVIKTNTTYSMVELKQKTRRKNQIRAQLQQLQHPIVGDRKYGATSSPIKRVALHASDMTIKHPDTGRMMIFKADIPKAMTRLLV